MAKNCDNLSVAETHQFKIAKSTLRLSDFGARMMGGMSKEAARKFLYERCGWSDKRIADLENE